MVFIFKDIEESYDIRVLAHLENFNFSSLKLNIGYSHLFLGHDLNCNIFASFLMSCSLNETELTLTKCLFYIIVVSETRIANNLLYSFDPLYLLFGSL